MSFLFGPIRSVWFDVNWERGRRKQTSADVSPADAPESICGAEMQRLTNRKGFFFFSLQSARCGRFAGHGRSLCKLREIEGNLLSYQRYMDLQKSVEAWTFSLCSSRDLRESLTHGRPPYTLSRQEPTVLTVFVKVLS